MHYGYFVANRNANLYHDSSNFYFDGYFSRDSHAFVLFNSDAFTVAYCDSYLVSYLGSGVRANIY